MRNCGDRTSNWAWAVHESIMTLSTHLAMDWSDYRINLKHQVFRRTSLFHYNKMIIVKNSVADPPSLKSRLLDTS